MIWIEFAVLIGMILIGSQMKGIGLGVMGMVGLFIFVFGIIGFVISVTYTMSATTTGDSYK